VVVDARDPLQVVPVDPPVALAFLARLETASGIPPVDEDEQRRLAGHEAVRDRDWDWGAHLVTAGDVVVAYAGTRLPPVADAVPSVAARVDLALDGSHPSAPAALVVALEDARDHAARAGGLDHGHAPAVQAWLRGATEDDLGAAARIGFEVAKRLHVLGVDLRDVAAIETSPRDAAAAHDATVGQDAVRVRSYRADAADRAAVAELLAAVYPESGGAWDEAGVAVRESRSWFNAEDLLLLEQVDGVPDGVPDSSDGGTGTQRRSLVGLHWTKRRSADVGEVHNLAVHPDAHGRGYGPLLLDAGLAHLAAVGSREVVLWVDSENTRALRLYRSRGFTTRWDDVALRG